MDNIINNPDDEKYRRIKLSNRVFQEKVASLEGTTEFLEAAGFEKQIQSINGSEEEFFVFSEVCEESLENLQVSAVWISLVVTKWYVNIIVLYYNFFPTFRC